MEIKAPQECSMLQQPEEPPAPLLQVYLDSLQKPGTQVLSQPSEYVSRGISILHNEVWPEDGKPIVVQTLDDHGKKSYYGLQTGPEPDLSNPSSWNSSYQYDGFDHEKGVRDEVSWIENKTDGKVDFDAFFNVKTGRLDAETGTIADSNNHVLSNFHYQFDKAGNVTQCSSVKGFNEDVLYKKTRLADEP